MKSMKLCVFALALTSTLGLAWAGTGEATAVPAGAQKATAGKPVAGQVWNWSKIDTNKDGLIEPAEMEAWLKANPGEQTGD